MAATFSTATDWYTSKQRVDFYLQKANIISTSVDDFVMDDAYEWVNGRLSTKDIDATDPLVAADLKTKPLIRQAQTWYACFLVIRTINANLNQAALVPDAPITSQVVGQGDHSVGYGETKNADDEKPTPDYYHMAQRSINEFFANVVDSFIIPPQSVMASSNAYRREPYWTAADDHANRLRKTYIRRRR
jgi:hypothetical protein